MQQMGFSALVIFQIPALQTFGLSAREAGLAVLIWTIGGLPGRLASGFLADKFDKRFVLAAAFIMQLVGLFFFLTTTNLFGATLYGVTHGIGWGMTTPSRLAFAGRVLGPRHLRAADGNTDRHVGNRVHRFADICRVVV